MPVNDSSTGGPLLPTSTFPLNDEALDIFFQGYFAALTGLAPHYVRPRWQEEPPTAPATGATWATVGVTEIDDDACPTQLRDGEDATLFQRQEQIGVLCSFYGDKAQQATRLARDAILIAQNRDPLTRAGFAYAYTSPARRAPLLLQNRWTNRIDTTFTFRRLLCERYAILDLIGADGAVVTDRGLGVGI